jgi:hypothetical protein
VLAAALAAIVMLGGLAAAQTWFADLLANGAGRVLVLLILAGGGTAVYLVISTLMHSDELAQLRRYASRRRTRAVA